MKVIVSGFTDGKKIMAIKGIRAATGLGLKEAKDVADAVERGAEMKVDIDPAREHELGEGGVVYQRVLVDVPLGDFVELLSRYPRDMAVGTIVDVLSVAAAADSAASPRKDA